MFGFFKSKPKPDGNPITEVSEHLKIMGYDLTPYGAGVALLEVQSGYSSVETASHIALTTLALDVKRAGNDFPKMLALYTHGMALLEVLKGYRDQKLMRESMWENDSQAVYHVANIDAQQLSWIEKILSDPVAGNERLANSRIKYPS
jgi:hypothetical protein